MTTLPGLPGGAPIGLRLTEGLILSLFAYISLVPFYYLRPLQLSGDLPPLFLPKYLPLFLSVALVLVWLFGVFRGARPLRLPPESWAFPYLVTGLLSLVGASYPWIGLWKWGYYHLTGLLLGYVIVQSFRDWAAIQRLVNGVVYIAGICVVYTLLSFVLGRDLLWAETQAQNNPYTGGTLRAAAPFGNPVSTAAYLALCLPFMAWQALRSGAGLPRRAVALSLVALTALVIFLTQSRGGWLAVGAATLVALLMLAEWAWRRVAAPRRWAALIIVLLGLPVGAEWVQNTGLLRLLEPQIRYMEHRTGLLSGPQLEQTEHFRLAQYSNVRDILYDHPLLGVGFGNFTRYFEDHRASTAVPETDSPVHTTDNMYLMFAAETGLVGLGAILFFLAALFWHLYRHQRTAPPAPRYLVLAFLLTSAGFLANMLTWDPLNDPTLRLTFWILAGIAMAAAHRS